MPKEFVSFPWMKNALMWTAVAVLFISFIVVVETILKADLPEVLWGLIGMVATKLFDMASKVVDIYAALVAKDD